MTLSIRHSLGNTKNWFRYYWKALIVAVSLLVAAVTGLVFAADVHEVGGPLGMMMDSITNTTQMSDVVNRLAVTIDGGFQTVRIYGIEIQEASNFMVPIYNVCVGVAICFVCITFFTGLMNIRSTELTEEMVYRKLILFVISILMCANAYKVAGFICNLGSGITATVATSYQADNSGLDALKNLKAGMYYSIHTDKYFYEDIPEEVRPYVNELDFEKRDGGDVDSGGWESILKFALRVNPLTGPAANAVAVVNTVAGNKMDWLTTVGHLFVNMSNMSQFTTQLMIPFIVSYISRLIIFFTIAGRGIEILLMCAFSPLMFMDASSLEDFTHSSAWRYLKSMFALSLQGAIIIGIMLVGNAMMAATLRDGIVTQGFFEATTQQGATAINLIVVVLTEAGMCMRSGQIARSIVQAG